MTPLIKFIICFLIAVAAYGLGRFAASTLFDDLALVWLGAIGGASAATAFSISGRLLGIVNFRKKDPDQDQS